VGDIALVLRSWQGDEVVIYFVSVVDVSRTRRRQRIVVRRDAECGDERYANA